MPILLSILLTLAGLGSAYADPRSHYLIHCMGCHLQDGRGNPPEVPVFDQGLLALMETDEGRAYLIQVPGSSQSPISDESLTAVLNWILKEFGGLSDEATLRPLQLEEVKKYRPKTLLNPIKTRVEMTF